MSTEAPAPGDWLARMEAAAATRHAEEERYTEIVSLAFQGLASARELAEMDAIDRKWDAEAVETDRNHANWLLGRQD